MEATGNFEERGIRLSLGWRKPERGRPNSFDPLPGETWVTNCLESLILAQDERWRRALPMRVERYGAFGSTTVASG